VKTSSEKQEVLRKYHCEREIAVEVIERKDSEKKPGTILGFGQQFRLA
jgi:hypothetical protein